MDERQHQSVQKRRAQIEDLKRKVEALSAAGLDASSPKIQKALDRVRQKQMEYARYRLKEGLGPDAIHVDDELLEEALKNIVDKSRISRLADKMVPMRIGSTARRSLLLSGFSFAEALAFSNDQQGQMLSFLSERSPLKNALRRWALQTQDPFIQETVAQLHRLAENFESTISLLARRVDRLRHRYEDKQKKPDKLELERSGSRTLLCTSSEWTNLASSFPEDAKEVYGIFRSLEQQLKEIEEIKELLNAEVRKFITTVLPNYLAYVQQQSSQVRRSILGRAKLSVKVAERMMREAGQADYLLGGSGLPVPHPKIPREFRAIQKLRDYQNFKRSAGIDQLQKQDTVEFPTNR